jgi:Redoxin
VSGSLPRLMEFYETHQADRDRFEVLAFHDASAKSFAELDEKLKPLIEQRWKGKSLPFPILLDASGATVKRYGIQGFPTLILIDPDGRVVKGGSEAMLAAKLKAANGK